MPVGSLLSLLRGAVLESLPQAWANATRATAPSVRPRRTAAFENSENIVIVSVKSGMWLRTPVHADAQAQARAAVDLRVPLAAVVLEPAERAAGVFHAGVEGEVRRHEVLDATADGVHLARHRERELLPRVLVGDLGGQGAAANARAQVGSRPRVVHREVHSAPDLEVRESEAARRYHPGCRFLFREIERHEPAEGAVEAVGG